MDIKKKIIIKGQRVHNVGYRPFLLGVAESMEIERFFAKNIFIDEKQVVHALVDSSEEKVKSFIDIVSSEYPEKSEVENVEVEDLIGNVMKIESYYRYLTAMQLSKIATYGGKMLEKQDMLLNKQDESLKMQNSMLNKQDESLKMQNSMLNKQDESLKMQNSMLDKQDESLKMQNSMLDKQDESLKTLNNINSDTSEIKSTTKTMEMDIRDARFNLSHLIETKFK
jgi:acylphosphatase